MFEKLLLGTHSDSAFIRKYVFLSLLESKCKNQSNFCVTRQ